MCDAARAGARGYHESAALTKALQKALQLRDGGNDVVLGGRGNDATGYDYDQDIEFGSDAGAKARAKRQRQRLAHMHNLTGQRFGLRHQARQPPKRSIQLAGRGQVG